MPEAPLTQQHKRLRSLLKQRRKQREMSQTDLAEKLGYGQSYVSKVERGELRLEVVDFIAWCRALEVSYLDLLEEAFGR